MWTIQLDANRFKLAFDRFKELVEIVSGGHPFNSFQDGLPAVWESYKPRLRQHARAILDPGSWSEESFGSGEILKKIIAAIEINEPSKNLQNNLVFWQNRFGHANRDHRALIEARTDTELCAKIEEQLHHFYCNETDEGNIFDRLAELTYAKYPPELSVIRDIGTV
jgi:hypothetical protein